MRDSKRGVMGAGEGSKLPVKGLFYGIGHQPNSQLVAGQIDLDDHGYVKVLVTPSTGSVHGLHPQSTWLTQTRHHISHHSSHNHRTALSWPSMLWQHQMVGMSLI